MNAKNLMFPLLATCALALASGAVADDCIPAPKFSLTGSDGKVHSLEQLTKKATVLVFFNSDCGHAGNSVPYFNRISKAFGPEVNLVGVYNADLGRTKEFATSNKATFVILADTKGDLATQYGAKNSTDFALLCPHDKAIVKTWFGLTRDNVKELMAFIPVHHGPVVKFDLTQLPEGKISGCGF